MAEGWLIQKQQKEKKDYVTGAPTKGSRLVYVPNMGGQRSVVKLLCLHLEDGG